MNPKILILSKSDNHGGAAKAAFRLMEGLLSKGLEVNMLVDNKTTSHPNVFSYHQLEEHNFGYFVKRIVWKIKNRIRKQKWKKYPNRENVFLNDLDSVSIINIIRKFDFDVLHLHFIANRFLNLKELRLIKKPIIWTLHDSWAFTGICHFTYECQKFERFCGNCPMLHSEKSNDFTNKIWKIKSKIYNDISLSIIAPSNWIASQVQVSSLLKEKRVYIIPNVIDLKFLSNKSELFKPFFRFSLEKKYILFGAVNSLEDQNKGFNFVTKSLEIFCLKVKSEVELIIYGSESKVSNIGNIMVHNLGVLNSKEIIYLLRNVNVALVPSKSENLSNTIMESMACSVPVVAFNIGGNSDLITHMEDGYLARPFDCEDYSNGILWCLSNEDLGERTRTKIISRFNPMNAVDRHIDLFKSVYYGK